MQSPCENFASRRNHYHTYLTTDFPQLPDQTHDEWVHKISPSNLALSLAWLITCENLRENWLIPTHESTVSSSYHWSNILHGVIHSPIYIPRLVVVVVVFVLLSWLPVCGLCPNHEVVIFQPRTVTPPYLASVVNCYVATPFFLTRSALLCPSLPSPWFPSEGGDHTRTWPLFHILPSCSHTGSFYHMGVTCLPPSIPILIDHWPIFWILYVPVSSYGFTTPSISPTLLHCLRNNIS